jgi:dsDNA-specific endonuclease/ATPase MutS2
MIFAVTAKEERIESVGTYIIHFDDKPWEDLDDELYYRCFEIPWFSTTKTTISRLTPYTEDSAYAHGYTEAESKFREIRDELEKQAYQKGHQDAYDTAYKDAKEIYESGKRAMYQKGLKDAWECARKISSMDSYTRNEIFEEVITTNILEHNSASKCIEKNRQYEQEKKEQIQVGDEVISPSGKGVVTEITDIYVRIMYAKGSGQVVKPEDLTKTGRHFPEIAEVLAKMKDADNG